jgi:hypothetical protein
MKRQKSGGPRLGKLVHQLLGVVTFEYDLCFRRMIARWKGIIKEIHFGVSIMPLVIIENLDPKKPSFRPSKWPRKLKLLKIVNCQNCQKTILSELEKVGSHRAIDIHLDHTLLKLGTSPNDDPVQGKINKFVSLHIIKVSNKDTLCALWIKCLPLFRGNLGPCT